MVGEGVAADGIAGTPKIRRARTSNWQRFLDRGTAVSFFGVLFEFRANRATARQVPDAHRTCSIPSGAPMPLARQSEVHCREAPGRMPGTRNRLKGGDQGYSIINAESFHIFLT
jgi:hypothetical protein